MVKPVGVWASLVGVESERLRGVTVFYSGVLFNESFMQLNPSPAPRMRGGTVPLGCEMCAFWPDFELEAMWCL